MTRPPRRHFALPMGRGVARRAGAFLRGTVEEVGIGLRIWRSRWEVMGDRFAPWRPFFFPGLLILSISLAWLAQSSLHVLVGGTPPGSEAYGLVPGFGALLTEAPTWSRAVCLYTVAIAVFLLAVMVAPRGMRSLPGGIVHLEGEPFSPLRRRPERGVRVLFGALLLIGVPFFLLLHLFVLATARIDVFPAILTPKDLPGRMLLWAVSFLPVENRPSWAMAYGLYLLQLPVLGFLVHAWGRWRGLPWRVPRMSHLSPPRRVWWEWPAAGIVAIIFTLVALHRVEVVPYVIQQDDGIGARFSQELVRPGSTMNIFGNDWIPNPAVAPRGVTIALFGNSNAVLRQTSAVIGGMTMLAAFFCYRALFAAGTSLALLLLTALSFHAAHFARVGTMHIDSLLAMFLALGVFFRAELSGPGPRRTALYGAAGALVGICHGLYPASRLSAITIGGMLVVRLFFQAEPGRRRLFDLGFLIFCALVFIAPFKAYNGPSVDRANEVYLLSQPHLQNEFVRLEQIGRPVDSVQELVAHHLKNALGVFHYRSDNSHNLSSPFPAASPLVASLSLLGGALLLLRFRSWLALVCLGTYLGACLFGGALRFGPHAPSSSRMITLVPILMIAAGVPLSLLGRALRGAAAAAPARLGQFAPLFVPVVVAGFLWVLAQEAWTNRALYQRCLNDPSLRYNAWMSHSTELQRFVESRVPAPDVIHHFGADFVANQSYYHNDFLLPHTVGRRFWIPPGESFNPARGLYPGTTWFIFHRTRLGELSPIREAFPGGRILIPPPVDIHGYPSRYVIYEYFNGWAPGPVHPVWPWW